MTLDAQTVLTQHVKTWDMPTLNAEHPEMVRWVADRWEVHFGIASEVIVVDKKANTTTTFATNDTRVALRQMLEDEIAKTPVHNAYPGASNPPGRCHACKQPVRRDGLVWVHADTGAVAAPNLPEED